MLYDLTVVLGRQPHLDDFLSSKSFAVADYVREMTATNSCKYCKYGSFQYLLYLLPQNYLKVERLTSYFSQSLLSRSGKTAMCVAGDFSFCFVHLKIS